MSEEDVEMFYKQAVSYMGQGETEKALEFFDKALAIDNYYLPAWNDKGVVLMELKDYHEARDCFRRVIVLDPDDNLAYYNKGYVELILEDYKDSVETFNVFLAKYMKKNDFYKYALYLKAKAHYGLKEYDQALMLLENAIKKDGTFKEARELLISILNENKNKNKKPD
jgi:lipoprotein NlpI